METRTLPLFAWLGAPKPVRIFPCGRGWELSHTGCFSQSPVRVLCVYSSFAMLIPPGLVCSGPLVSALPPVVPGQPSGASVALLSPLSSLPSQMQRNVRLPGCVSQSKGSGRFLPDLIPWPVSGNYLSVEPPHYVKVHFLIQSRRER